jgi:FtsP/CotA-like multicopper oxidase with cupredoxin domain
MDPARGERFSYAGLLIWILKYFMYKQQELHPLAERRCLVRLRNSASTIVAGLTLLFALVSLPLVNCSAQAHSASEACPRPTEGAVVTNPPELRSHDGILEVSLHLRYEKTRVSQGPPRYCFVTDDGQESPTLRVLPGDTLIIHLHNDLPPERSASGHQHATATPSNGEDCGEVMMDTSSTNLHFHGMTIPPICHQDDVIHTAVHSGESFDYYVIIPANEAPGLYWYHPHPHGFSERQIQGGASGALIVDGLETRFPFASELPERVILLRDQQRIGPEAPGAAVPSWDLSINFVPIIYPKTVPAIIPIAANEKQLWRVANASADTIYDLEILTGQTSQPLQILALDGVPLPTPQTQTEAVLPPGARAEFVVTGPAKGQDARLITKAWDTGPAGDNDTQRTIANLVNSGYSATPLPVPRQQQRGTTKICCKSPADSGPVVQRLLYFSQRSSNPQDPDNFVLYFITVEGQTPAPYKMGSPPNIVVHQGDVEEWTIENRSDEDHVFHIHQIHFKVLKVNGRPVADPAMRDTIDVPYWSGKGPFPSVTLRMNFSDPNTVGTFLYHCHILKHEDMGMMGSIQVLPRQCCAEASLP